MMIKNFEKFNENNIQKPKAKYKKGDKVNYLPKISGLNPKKVFTIKYVNWKNDSDDGMLKEKPQWMYGFEDISLSARETEIKKIK
jgi:hypothetical protein